MHLVSSVDELVYCSPTSVTAWSNALLSRETRLPMSSFYENRTVYFLGGITHGQPIIDIHRPLSHGGRVALLAVARRGYITPKNVARVPSSSSVALEDRRTTPPRHRRNTQIDELANPHRCIQRQLLTSRSAATWRHQSKVHRVEIFALVKMNTLIGLAILASVANCLAFGGDDRYIKKYAMMKASTREASIRAVSTWEANRWEASTWVASSWEASRPLYRPFQQHNSVSQGGYYPQQFPEPLYYPTGNSLYNPQAYPVPFNPFYQGQQPFYPQGPAYFGQRSSRDLDLRGQLETLTSRIGGKIRNVTCVMQELGYIHERIGRLPVTLEFKRDMADGVEFCKQFSHKKLEACIMKDVRERYSQSEDLSDEDAMGGGELRSLSWDDAKGSADGEDMATAMYEFLYGGDNMEFETLM
uniref:Uncharacterized protein n=1 Tax=Timema shepardi TaxID=629360 RepID=A0A7R9AVS0_TIMSH|nr:unnamed protein product [Timema shepardi]